MADNISAGNLEDDLQALKDAFCAQQILLQKLYVELDKEREASASAASEALSMILRLQEEKAAAKLEASQYKRMADDKLSRAAECLAYYEDVIYQRDLEIASLKYQVQAYRYKLLSLGCHDLELFEERMAESLLLGKNLFNGEIDDNGAVKRINSLPAVRGSDSCYKTPRVERSAVLQSTLTLQQEKDIPCQESNVPSSASEKNSAAQDVIREPIKTFNEQVKEEFVKNGSAKVKDGSESSSVISEDNTFPLLKRGGILIPPEDHVRNYASSSSFVHDVFEVPPDNSICKTTLPGADEQNGSILGGDRLAKPTSISKETSELKFEDETELPILKDIKSAGRILGRKQTRELTEAHEQGSQIIEQLEEQRRSRRLEITEQSGEELGCLKEINKQLNTAESETKCLRTKKSSTPENSVTISLMEEMLHFWL